MIELYPVSGPPIAVAEGSITLIAGPYPSDVGPYTYVHGFGPGVVVSLEPVQHLILRLGAKPPLLQFVRPDNSPVWIKAGAVTNVTLPLPPGQYSPEARSVIWLGPLRQAVKQTSDVVEAQIKGAAGAASLLVDAIVEPEIKEVGPAAEDSAKSGKDKPRSGKRAGG